MEENLGEENRWKHDRNELIGERVYVYRASQETLGEMIKYRIKYNNVRCKEKTRKIKKLMGNYQVQLEMSTTQVNQDT
jgi:hypothetical protein